MASEDTTTQTGTSTSTQSNPAIAGAATKIANQMSNVVDAGPRVVQMSQFSPAGATTQDAWQKAINGANSMIGSGGFTSAQSGIDKQYQDLYGAYDQNAPGFQNLRQNAIDDAIKNVGAGFNSSGRFGGGSYIDGATKGAFDAASGLDYANYQNGVNNKLGILGSRNALQQQGLSNLNNAYAGLGAVGGAQDANQQGILSGQFDLATRNQNAWTDLLSKLSSAAAGNAAGGGTTTTSSQTTPTTPWYQSLGGMALQAL